jgi:hypothetical protein
MTNKLKHGLEYGTEKGSKSGLAADQIPAILRNPLIYYSLNFNVVF